MLEDGPRSSQILLLLVEAIHHRQTNFVINRKRKREGSEMVTEEAGSVVLDRGHAWLDNSQLYRDLPSDLQSTHAIGLLACMSCNRNKLSLGIK